MKITKNHIAVLLFCVAMFMSVYSTYNIIINNNEYISSLNKDDNLNINLNFNTVQETEIKPSYYFSLIINNVINLIWYLFIASLINGKIDRTEYKRSKL